jgi:hypothetical protein
MSGRDEIAALVAARELTHGDFAEVARVIQGIKEMLRSGPSWERMSPRQREAVDMIGTKLARIVCGDPDHLDHWRDTGGYADRGGMRK